MSTAIVGSFYVKIIGRPILGSVPTSQTRCELNEIVCKTPGQKVVGVDFRPSTKILQLQANREARQKTTLEFRIKEFYNPAAVAGMNLK